ncbi:MAG: IS110 family transposase [Bacteroidota bacterium]|nr:IS110 family transposase [Bacteroidota bacterium]
MKNYVDSIGVDISKQFFDAVLFLSGEHEKFANERKGFVSFEKWLKKHGINPENVLVCFENTGYYSLNLAIYLTEKRYDYVQEHALQIKRSIGIRRGKSDKTDATDIAKYAWLNRENLRLSKPPSKSLLTLQQTRTTRELLVKQTVAIKNQLKGLVVVKNHHISGMACNSLKRVLLTLEKQIRKLEYEIEEQISQDEELSKTFTLCRSVTGVGVILALEMIIHTQNFTSFNEWRKFAAYCGTVPYPYQSGTSIRGKARIHPSSDQHMKSLLTMASLSALRVDPELRRYYKRRVEEGKPKMSVINMIRNKMLARIFSIVKRGTPFVTMSKFAA